MTREEAIRCLSVHSSTNGSGLCTDKQHYEAKQVAIKALEQEPCDDAISRQAAIYVASGFCHPANIADELAKLPPVNPQPKTGHWVEEDRYIDRYDDTIEILQCSLCGFKHHYAQGDTSKTDYTWYNYCPNCGARMEEQA